MALIEEKTQRLPIISFAIPTYNFGKYITETVNSIFDGMTSFSAEDVEIVILDGGSTDDTEDVVRDLSQVYANITYKKNTRRGGIDRDLDEVALMATGRYIWLFSADDTLCRGWDVNIKNAITSDADIILAPAMLCSLNMKIIRPNPIFSISHKKKLKVWEFDEYGGQIDDYLKSSRTLEALFSFLGAVVVKASFWRILPKREDYYGTCWAHCARLIPAFRRKAKVVYITELIIKKRGENDSFMEHGLVNRISIAVDGWTRIINEFFKEKSIKRKLFSRLRGDMPLALFLYAKTSTRNDMERSRLNRLARQHWLFNSMTPQSILSYVLYWLFPVNRFISRVVDRNLSTLKGVRHKARSFFR
jgi:abequosyltransferase